MNEPVAGSPAWWLAQLEKRLLARQPEIIKADNYYEGNHELKFVSDKYREAFAKMLRDLSDNWMALVVDAVEERLHVEGFRVGDGIETDKDAWQIWQRNHLDADSELLHQKTLTTGVGYAMVWYGTDGLAEITVEDPAEVFVAYQGGSRRNRQAAVKIWCDEWSSTRFANVYLPDGIWKFEAAANDLIDRAAQWKPRRGDERVENPLGIVPIVEFRNRPRMNGTGRSEIQTVMSTQDQVNKLVCDMLISSEFAAFQQRWATGLELDVDPDTGEEKVPFKPGIDRVWAVGDPEVKFGAFPATDLRNAVVGIENRIQSIASRTRTPPHYLLGNSGTFPSGESLKATETGLVAKVHSKQRHLGESHEEVMRIAGLIEGTAALSSAEGAEVKWRDAESRTEAEHVDALVKLRTIGVPNQQLWEDAGYTPQQTARFRQMLLDEAMNQLLAAPAPPVPVA